MCWLPGHRFSLSLIFFLLLLISFPAQASLAENDEKALDGVKAVKAVYDMQVKKPDRFAFFLEVIEKTYDSILGRGVQAEFVVAVRGPAIRFVSKETWSFSEEDQKHLEDAAELMSDLDKRGVRFEACSIAAGLFKVDHKTYVAGVKPVSNTFVSLTGYQAQGYGLVPVH